jgi:hypothetical protein
MHPDLTAFKTIHQKREDLRIKEILTKAIEEKFGIEQMEKQKEKMEN